MTTRHELDPRLLVWLACTCRVWPISPLFPIYRCGECRQRPARRCPQPADGKAYRL